MQPVKKVSRWACGSCGKAHREKERAVQCCKCPQCERRSTHMGTGFYCALCGAENRVATEEERLKHAQDNLVAAKERLAEIQKKVRKK